MIRISEIKIPIFEIALDAEKEISLLKKKAAAMLGCGTEDIRKLRISRKSVDLRDKERILFVYTADVKLKDSLTGPNRATELSFIGRLKKRNVTQAPTKKLIIPEAKDSDIRPVVVGSGPAGLFAAVALIEAGLKPIILERGLNVEERIRKTESFFAGGALDPECNIQFGEGGAGTFSDGKLMTSLKDREGYISYVLEHMVSFGAPESVTYEQKAHLGTDMLSEIIKNIRRYIEERGGEYIFRARFEDIESDNGRLTGIYYTELSSGRRKYLRASHLILAIGHSAIDTCGRLLESGIHLEKKAFAVGLRVMHPQELIDRAMYGEERLREKVEILGAASYKLTYVTKKGRNVYSFCMCPGGYVIDASSGEGFLAVNGMSCSDRSSGSANSAIVVGVTPEDFPGDDVMSGVRFQREIEKRSFEEQKGAIPIEAYETFRDGPGDHPGIAHESLRIKGRFEEGDLRKILPDFVSEAIIEGMEDFGRKIEGFNGAEAVLAAPETRTSSVLRILRNEEGYAPGVKGLYPAGEGAGYAGGITSSAADGVRQAIRLIRDL